MSTIVGASHNQGCRPQTEGGARQGVHLQMTLPGSASSGRLAVLAVGVLLGESALKYGKSIGYTYGIQDVGRAQYLRGHLPAV